MGVNLFEEIDLVNLTLIFVISKEQLQEILKKKKECNAIALKIVETLSEQEVNKEWMINNVSLLLAFGLC